jgi:hypothetical protein
MRWSMVKEQVNKKESELKNGTKAHVITFTKSEIPHGLKLIIKVGSLRIFRITSCPNEMNIA